LNTGINKRKIINDPVHGIITVPGDFIYDLIEHPCFQRLRNIKQLGLTEFVYPGASHSRFIHSIGALHLMNQALETLKQKGIDISLEENEAALIAILLHDTGHSPFSHALEFHLVNGVSHEQISSLFMELLDREFDGRIRLAIDMFRGDYRRRFFHDLISCQIDMDRLVERSKQEKISRIFLSLQSWQLKPVIEHLKGSVSYEEAKLVRAFLRRTL